MKKKQIAVTLALLMMTAFITACKPDNTTSVLQPSEGLEYMQNEDGRSFSVTGIGSCSDTDIVIPSSYDGSPVTRIEDSAFISCENLVSVTIPDGVTSIGDDAFSECSNLTSVTIPGSVTTIGDCAFSLSGLIKITIPENVTYIGNQAFAYCSELESISVEEGNTQYRSAGNCIIETTTNTLIAGCNNSVIPDDGSVTKIGEWAFEGCFKLENITIPDCVTSIGDSAFWFCAALTSITIPDGVRRIGKCAFSGCLKLTSITISKSVTSIGEALFFNSSRIESIYVAEENPYYHSAGNCIIETRAKTLIAGCKNSVIPNDGSVTKIGKWGLAGNHQITCITIPDGVTSIGECAFDSCAGLTSITIPKSVTSIGNRILSGCTSLESISVSNRNTRYHSSGNCIIETQTGILIAGCKNSVIPTDGSVKSIGKYAFMSCSELTNITIPKSVASIGDFAFYYCNKLTNIIIPDSVTSIGIEAFCNCFALENITIPASVTKISDCAFEDCTELTSIIFTGTKSRWEAIEKGDGWNNSTGDYTIHCTDGEIAK